MNGDKLFSIGQFQILEQKQIENKSGLEDVIYVYSLYENGYFVYISISFFIV